MSELFGVTSKIRAVMLISVALNIFLVAFFLGRTTIMPLRGVKPFKELHQEQGELCEDEGFADGGEHMPPPPHGEHHGHMPPPPPFFGPDDLFTHEEMEQQMSFMRENFDKMDAMRREFANRIAAQPVSKDQVIQHFNEVDKVMTDLRLRTQAKAAEKISKMTQEERKAFAEKLVRHHP
jgi:hypothetical protein